MLAPEWYYMYYARFSFILFLLHTLSASPEVSADTVVVCPAEFREALKEWTVYRQGQGHRHPAHDGRDARHGDGHRAEAIVERAGAFAQPILRTDPAADLR